MKYELPCEVVQDLLPSYIDSLTSETTKESVDSHLENCEKCRKIKEAMFLDCEQNKVNVSEKKIIKRTKRKIIRAFVSALLCITVFVGLFSGFLGWYNTSDLVKAKDLDIAVNKVNASQLNFCIIPDGEKKGEISMSFDGLETEITVTKQQIAQIKERGYIYQISIESQKHPIDFVIDDVLSDGTHQIEVWSQHSDRFNDMFSHSMVYRHDIIVFGELSKYINFIDNALLVDENTPIGTIEISQNDNGEKFTESPDAEKVDLIEFDINTVESYVDY